MSRMYIILCTSDSELGSKGPRMGHFSGRIFICRDLIGTEGECKCRGCPSKDMVLPSHFVARGDYLMHKFSEDNDSTAGYYYTVHSASSMELNIILHTPAVLNLFFYFIKNLHS